MLVNDTVAAVLWQRSDLDTLPLPLHRLNLLLDQHDDTVNDRIENPLHVLPSYRTSKWNGQEDKEKERKGSASILRHSVKAVLNILCRIIRYSGNIYFAAFQVCGIPKLKFDFLLPGPEHFVLAAGLVAVSD